jgi:hypothetical protein
MQYNLVRVISYAFLKVRPGSVEWLYVFHDDQEVVLCNCMCLLQR